MRSLQRRDGVPRCGSRYSRDVTSVELIHAGYIRDDSRVGSSISLIRDGSAIVVADPGLVSSHAGSSSRLQHAASTRGT